MSDTRQQILDAALDLFVEQGYDKASLREIAERVGVTKAALYYHFPSKEQMLNALLQPLNDVQRDTVARMGKVESLDDWALELEWLVEWVLANRRLFLLMQRNAHTLENHSQDAEYLADHLALHDALERALDNPKVAIADRVRMACALGAVVGCIGFGTSFSDIPPDTLRPLVLNAMRAVLTS